MNLILPSRDEKNYIMLFFKNLKKKKKKNQNKIFIIFFENIIAIIEQNMGLRLSELASGAKWRGRTWYNTMAFYNF